MTIIAENQKNMIFSHKDAIDKKDMEIFRLENEIKQNFRILSLKEKELNNYYKRDYSSSKFVIVCDPDPIFNELNSEVETQREIFKNLSHLYNNQQKKNYYLEKNLEQIQETNKKFKFLINVVLRKLDDIKIWKKIEPEIKNKINLFFKNPEIIGNLIKNSDEILNELFGQKFYGKDFNLNDSDNDKKINKYNSKGLSVSITGMGENTLQSIRNLDDNDLIYEPTINSSEYAKNGIDSPNVIFENKVTHVKNIKDLIQNDNIPKLNLNINYKKNKKYNVNLNLKSGSNNNNLNSNTNNTNTTEDLSKIGNKNTYTLDELLEIKKDKEKQLKVLKYRLNVLIEENQRFKTLDKSNFIEKLIIINHISFSLLVNV